MRIAVAANGSDAYVVFGAGILGIVAGFTGAFGDSLHLGMCDPFGYSQNLYCESCIQLMP